MEEAYNCCPSYSTIAQVSVLLWAILFRLVPLGTAVTMVASLSELGTVLRFRLTAVTVGRTAARGSRAAGAWGG